MSRAKIKIEFMAGERIENAFSEAIRLSKMLGVGVEFNFNDVTCYTGINATIEKGTKEYFKQLRKKTGNKYAVA